MLLGVGAIVSWILTHNRVTQKLADARGHHHRPVDVHGSGRRACSSSARSWMRRPSWWRWRRSSHRSPGSYGVPDVQFGLVFVVTCLIGLVTPPVGVILFMTSAFAKIKLEQVFNAILPFVFAAVVLISLLILFPPLTLYVPSSDTAMFFFFFFFFFSSGAKRTSSCRWFPASPISQLLLNFAAAAVGRPRTVPQQ